MHDDDRVLEVIRGWIEKAENDLRNATITLRAGRDCPADTVAFHAQQCAEKYLKALLTRKQADVPRMHDIGELIRLSGIDVDLAVEQQRLLTDYATVTRYPGAYDPVSFAEARRAVTFARRVRAAVRRELPARIGKPRRR